MRYSAVNPVAGVTFRATPALNAYASYGRGFETPTLNDLAYRSTNGSVPGLNLGLQPARSNNYEVGIKAGGSSVRADARRVLHRDRATSWPCWRTPTAARCSRTSARPRGTGRNSLSMRTPAADSRPGSLTPTSVPWWGRRTRPARHAVQPAIVAAGSYLPAVPRNALYAGLTWNAPLGFSTTIEEQGRARIYADDRNTAAAPGYWETNLRAGVEQQTPRWQFSEFVRLDNVTDRTYVGSVIVDESNSRYFEPAPGRTAYVMFNARWRVQ